jgi:hypothetical protein
VREWTGFSRLTIRLLVFVTTGGDCLCGSAAVTSTPYICQMIRGSIWRGRGMIMTGENRRFQRKTCSSATSPTAYPTWTTLGANPVLRDEKPATNRPSTRQLTVACCCEQSSTEGGQIIVSPCYCSSDEAR